MSHEKELEELLRELERVGVDPNTISAGLAVDRGALLHALRSLPDGAGPSAFLGQLRQLTAENARE